jgi:hypothetical protein
MMMLIAAEDGCHALLQQQRGGSGNGDSNGGLDT